MINFRSASKRSEFYENHFIADKFLIILDHQMLTKMLSSMYGCVCGPHPLFCTIIVKKFTL